MNKSHIHMLARNAGVACQAAVDVIDIDERSGTVLARVTPGSEIDSVGAWLIVNNPLTIAWRFNPGDEPSWWDD